jgi:hypothetical protein
VRLQVAQGAEAAHEYVVLWQLREPAVEGRCPVTAFEFGLEELKTGLEAVEVRGHGIEQPRPRSGGFSIPVNT